MPSAPPIGGMMVEASGPMAQSAAPREPSPPAPPPGATRPVRKRPRRAFPLSLDPASKVARSRNGNWQLSRLPFACAGPSMSSAMPKVLVIDDEPKIADFVSRALSANGLVVDTATAGAQGVELARTGRYGLVVLDLL